jgi:hypothetical protein
MVNLKFISLCFAHFFSFLLAKATPKERGEERNSNLLGEPHNSPIIQRQKKLFFDSSICLGFHFASARRDSTERARRILSSLSCERGIYSVNRGASFCGCLELHFVSRGEQPRMMNSFEILSRFEARFGFASTVACILWSPTRAYVTQPSP